MTVRNKLTLQFSLITASILLTASLFIYYFSALYRQEEFYERLQSKANSTAKLLIEVNEVTIELLKIIDKNTASLPAEQIVIYNHQNEEIYNSNEAITPHFTRKLLDDIRIQEALGFRHDDREFLGILYTDRFNRFVVVASATDVYGLRKLRNLRLVLITVFGGSMMLVIAGGWLFSHQALKPMAHVIDQVDQISASNLYARVDEGNGQDEIAQLSQTFNKMLDRVEAAFAVQKSFVANASHELRTPLTAITGQIEVSLRKGRSQQEYQGVLHSILEDIRNLTHLSNVLLELAQINPDAAKIQFVPLRIDELLLESRLELMQRKQHYQINIEYLNFPEEEQGLLVMGNEPLLKSVFTNIMDNACKFSVGKPVEVCMDFKNTQTVITINDQGIGIRQEELQQICEPMYRATNAITFQGHGLGLSLAKKILNIHHVEMHIHSQMNEGTQIALQFPALRPAKVTSM